jgi:predicted amidophosphoribosyltransferase
VLELIPLGPTRPRPGHCLNCDDRLDAAGRCPDCKMKHQQLVARVHEHCGLPPQIERIQALRDQGLYRVALNAVHLRLQTNPDDVEALALCGRLLLELHRPAPAVAFLHRARALESTRN